MVRTTALVSMLLACSPLAAREWPLQVEREVDEGVYMSVVYAKDGWRVWRAETRTGSSCKAVKSAIGRPHPEPVGVDDMLVGGTPFISFSKGYDSRYWFVFQALHYGAVDYTFRRPGERFWEDNTGVFDDTLASYDGEIVELVVKSWEYPAIFDGYSEERARFSFAGLKDTMVALEQCDLGHDKS